MLSISKPIRRDGGDYYELLSRDDYYPEGAELPGRHPAVAIYEALFGGVARQAGRFSCRHRVAGTPSHVD